MDEADRPAAKEVLAKLQRGEQAAEATLHMQAKDASWRTIEWHAPASGDEGRCYWLGRDVTERTINGTSAAQADAYFAVDADRRVTEVNRGATELARVTRGAAAQMMGLVFHEGRHIWVGQDADLSSELAAFVTSQGMH